MKSFTSACFEVAICGWRTRQPDSAQTAQAVAKVVDQDLIIIHRDKRVAYCFKTEGAAGTAVLVLCSGE